MLNNLPNPVTEIFFPILSRESQISAWLLDKTGLFNFFSNLSIIFKTGKAVQEINNASASFISILDKVLYKNSWSTFPIS